MQHNKKSPFEKPLSECPPKCENCSYFKYGFCYANGVVSTTYGFSNPKDRPIPFPLNCFWWYANNVFDKMDIRKIKEYKETRLHIFTAYKILSELTDDKERKEFYNYFYRAGGGQFIEFEKYPKAKNIYNEIAITEI